MLLALQQGLAVGHEELDEHVIKFRHDAKYTLSSPSRAKETQKLCL